MTFGEPCFYCAVRPDVACSHRPADPDYRPPQPTVEKPKRDCEGQGLNFRAKRIKISGGGNYRKKRKT